MKIKSVILYIFLLFAFVFKINGETIIPITTNDISLIYKVDEKTGRLYQSYLGQKLSYDSDIALLPLGKD